jgi:hypothetical protein
VRVCGSEPFRAPIQGRSGYITNTVGAAVATSAFRSLIERYRVDMSEMDGGPLPAESVKPKMIRKAAFRSWRRRRPAKKTQAVQRLGHRRPA